jgi:hypothetical protein
MAAGRSLALSEPISSERFTPSDLLTTLQDGDIKEDRGSLDQTGHDLRIELGHALEPCPRHALAHPKAVSTPLPGVVSGEVLIDQRLEPRIGLLGELHHGGVPDRPIRSKPNGHADRAVDGKLGEEDHRGGQLARVVPADVETVALVLWPPSPLSLNGLLLL